MLPDPCSIRPVPDVGRLIVRNFCCDPDFHQSEVARYCPACYGALSFLASTRLSAQPGEPARCGPPVITVAMTPFQASFFAFAFITKEATTHDTNTASQSQCNARLEWLKCQVPIKSTSIIPVRTSLCFVYRFTVPLSGGSLTAAVCRGVGHQALPR